MTAATSERLGTPLLTLVGQGAVDEDYAFVARRRVESGTPVVRSSRHLVAAAGVAVFGLLIAIAAVQTARDSEVDSASRQLLIQRIDDRRAALADQKTQLLALRRQIPGLQVNTRRLEESLSGAQAGLKSVQLRTGALPVSGPGVQLTVTDDPAADKVGGDPDGLVRASDLRLLVNALWEAGADAVAINGRRLTALSSIVNANIAVQVNRGPISPPYVVTAVGDLSTLSGVLTDTDTGAAFAALADQFGFGVEDDPVTDLVVAAAPGNQLRLREARPVSRGASDQDGTS